MIADPRPELAEIHADAATDLWAQRPFLLCLPTTDRADIRDHDERLRSHLDALRLTAAEHPLLDERWARSALGDGALPPTPLDFGPLQPAYIAGDLAAILKGLDDPLLARRAGWAFTALTGQACREIPAPEGWQEPDGPDPDLGLPWPDADAARSWWQAHGWDGIRRRGGVADAWLLEHGTQPERAAVAPAGYDLTAWGWLP